MKLIKIRFTSWRDQSSEARTLAFRRQLDAWTAREVVLAGAAARAKEEQAHADSDALQKSLASIAAELETIDNERALLLAAEEASGEAETRAATKHERAATFGFQVWNDAGTNVGYVVDEAGHYLPPKAVYSYEVVDEDPPLPEWAKKGRIGG